MEEKNNTKTVSKDQYKMTSEEFLTNFQSMLQRLNPLGVSHNKDTKEELIKQSDLFNTFVHCHINDL